MMTVNNINGGDLYFNLGNVSEDVLNDNNWSYENGYPKSKYSLGCRYLQHGDFILRPTIST
jgi:cell surface protein SprA